MNEYPIFLGLFDIALGVAVLFVYVYIGIPEKRYVRVIASLCFVLAVLLVVAGGFIIGDHILYDDVTGVSDETSFYHRNTQWTL